MSKKYWLAAVLLLLLLTAVFSSAEAAQMLVNRGFESGMNYWEILYGSTLTPVVDSTTSHTGEKSIKVVGDGTTHHGGVMQDVSVLSGVTTYLVSGWIKTQNLASGWGGKIQVEFIGPQGGATTIGVIGGTTDWTYVQEIITVPDETVSIRIEGLLLDDQPLGLNNSGTAWFDELSVMPHPELLTNGNFELGISYWGAMWDSTLTPIADTTVYHWGAKSIRIAGDGTTHHGGFEQNVYVSSGGGTYMISGWIKTQDLASGWSGLIQLEFLDSGGQWLDIYYVGDVGGTNGWTYVQGTITVPSQTARIKVEGVLRDYHNSGLNNSGTAWFDDLSFSPIPAVDVDSFLPAGTTNGVFYTTDNQDLILTLSNELNQSSQVVAHVNVTDLSGTSVYTTDQTINMSALEQLHAETIRIPSRSSYGFYCVDVNVSYNGASIANPKSSFCVVSNMASGNQFLGTSVFGQGDPASVRRLGAGCVGFPVNWCDIEPNQGTYQFTASDAALQQWLDLGIRPIGMIVPAIDTVKTFGYLPQWAQQEFDTDDYYDDWGEFIHEAVDHFKDDIHTWSYVGELEAFSEAEVDRYIHLVSDAAAETKSLDSTCIIGGIGVSGEVLSAAEYPWQALEGCLDGQFFDPYIWPSGFGPGQIATCDETGNSVYPLPFTSMLTQAKDYSETYGKGRIAVAEKGWKIDTSLPVDSSYAKDLANVLSRSFVIAKSVPEVDHYLYFMANSEGCNEDGFDYGLWLRGSPRPSVAAYATTARMLMDTSNPTKVTVDNNSDVYAYVFSQGSGSVTGLWTIASPSPGALDLAVNLPSAATTYDLMGNATSITAGTQTLQLSNSPIFLTRSQWSLNLLTNEGFESGLWETLWSSTLTPALDSNVYHSGAKSARIAGDGTKHNGGVIRDVVALSGVTNYTIYGWIKTQGLASGWSGFIQVEYLDSGGQWLDIDYIGDVGGTNDWIYVQGTITVPSETATIKVGCVLKDYYGSGLNNSGTAWFDDISITEELLSNRGFENGTSSWGTLWGSTLTPVADTTVYHSGAKSLKIPGDGTTHHGGIVQTMPVLPNMTSYTLSGWLKTQGLASGWAALLMVEFLDADWNWLGITSGGVTYSTTDWQQGSFTFDVPFGTAYIMVEGVLRDDQPSGLNNSGTAWFDDLSLVPNWDARLVSSLREATVD